MRTYVFGAREPSQNLERINMQLALATCYRNALTEAGRLVQQATLARMMFKEEKNPDVRPELNRLIREARARNGLYWGTYLMVEAAFERALGTSKSALKFVRHDGSGKVSVQLPATSPLTVEKLLAGTDTRARIVGTGKHREFWIRVGSEGRAPVWAVAPFSYHRDLPAGALVVWVHLHAKRIATKLKWFVHVVCKGEETARPLEGGSGTIALDVGWRLLPDGSVRVAAGLNEKGERFELQLPAYLRERDQKVEDLRSIRDKNFNVAKKELKELMQGNTSLPAWFAEALSTLAQWQSPARLAAVVVRWRTERFQGDEALFSYAEAWRKQDKHLYEWECNQRQRVLRQRLEMYRLAALKLAKYSTVVVEKLDLRDFAERPKARADASNQRQVALHLEAPAITASRGRRFDAGLSILLGCIKQAVARAGGHYVEVAPEWTTQTCNACNEREKFDAVELMHTCSHCGATWDQDFNAAANLLKRGMSEAVRGPDAEVAPKPARSAVAQRRFDGKAKKKNATALVSD